MKDQNMKNKKITGLGKLRYLVLAMLLSLSVLLSACQLDSLLKGGNKTSDTSAQSDDGSDKKDNSDSAEEDSDEDDSSSDKTDEGGSAGVNNSGDDQSVAEDPNNPALADDWYLILVNKDNPVPEGYRVPELTELRNGQAVDSRIYPALQQMFDDARAQGILPIVRSSYRTHEDQQKMMDDKIKEFMDKGMNKNDAETEAKLWVAIPGTSEHEIGIAVDISTADWEQQEANVVWDWLNTHCYEYGFIQRYPDAKVSITGINTEPWHYRYVGKEVAKEMTEQGLCLEEYLGR